MDEYFDQVGALWRGSLIVSLLHTIQYQNGYFNEFNDFFFCSGVSRLEGSTVSPSKSVPHVYR